MIIDIHAHYTGAPPQLNAYRGAQISRQNRPGPSTLKISDDQARAAIAKRLSQMDRMGVGHLLFSPRAGGMGHDFGSELISRYWTEFSNDAVHQACRVSEGKLIPVCQLPQSPGVSPANCVEELERCVNDLGFVGCNINADVSGGLQPFTPSLRTDWWYPLWEKMVELDVPGMIHASSTQNPALHSNGAHYINVDTAAVVELCNSRVFEDFPALKLIIPHGGGAIPYQYSRHRSLHIEEKRPPFEAVIKNLYFDTCVYDADALELLIKRIGPDRVMYATEMGGTGKQVNPETGRPFDDIVDLIKDIKWLDEQDKAKIFETNAKSVYRRARWAA